MIEAGQLYEELFGHVPLGTTTSAWFQYLLHPRYRESWPVSKRLLDLGIGAVAAVIAAPILLIAAIAVKVGDGGPVLHRQRRMGEAGREFELVKLRTMSIEKDGPSWTGTDDERITPVGRFLRRSHIDELPQIWLVLKGEMSLVGPRPEQPMLVTELETRFSYYDRRHLVKPGITGWAQVRCGYSGSHIGSAWKLCHDLYYLKRRSVLFDLLIMLETLSTVAVPEPINRPDERFIVAARAAEELAPLERTTGLEPT
jgi:lipopolysaccharide/colanic/teichoic acid biosynthesis glycosyltransferase